LATYNVRYLTVHAGWAGLEYRHGETAAGRGGSTTIPLSMSPPSASLAEVKAKAEEDEMAAEEKGVEEEKKCRPAPLP
jgi:hypothetical protein